MAARALGSVWEVHRWDGCLFHSETPGLAPDRTEAAELLGTGACGSAFSLGERFAVDPGEERGGGVL